MATPVGSGSVPFENPDAPNTESQLRLLLCDGLGRSDGFFRGLMEEFETMPPAIRARAIRSAIEFYTQRFRERSSGAEFATRSPA